MRPDQHRVVHRHVQPYQRRLQEEAPRQPVPGFEVPAHDEDPGDLDPVLPLTNPVGGVPVGIVFSG